ncbi:hypothetical protein P280DRAFT_291579 [Massarina eburnea CBS 473.64]|uniref:Zinc finger PHD-type domain-containing protein n=1 Tax=Massarina eburnea CBS 473.64 TaxID=1395130 RepID=A0A6A6S6J5_9PLEO|nr:hypothetical protein P280DRAFT_291579 [Massarina eburnea CBS 473.64]
MGLIYFFFRLISFFLRLLGIKSSTTGNVPAVQVTISTPVHNAATANNAPPSGMPVSNAATGRQASPSGTYLPKSVNPPKPAEMPKKKPLVFGRTLPVNPFTSRPYYRSYIFSKNSPKVPTTTFVNKNAFHTSSPTYSVEIDMPDAPPLPKATPPTTPSKQATASPKPSGNPRPCRQPVSHGQRRDPRKAKSKITMEEDDGTLPQCYQGTWNTIQWLKPENSTETNCDGKLHHLSCGHWVASTKKVPCGVNCHEAVLDAGPFGCPTCLKAVEDAVNNKLSASEFAKAKRAMDAGQESFLIGYLVEFVAKYVDMKGNLTETVASLVKNEAGRACSAAKAPGTECYQSLEEQLQEINALKVGKKFAADNARKQGAKRGSADEASAQKKARGESPLQGGAAIFQSAPRVRKFSEEGEENGARQAVFQHNLAQPIAEFDARVISIGAETTTLPRTLARKRSLDWDPDMEIAVISRRRMGKSFDADCEMQFDPRVVSLSFSPF